MEELEDIRQHLKHNIENLVKLERRIYEFQEKIKEQQAKKEKPPE